jgi:hypothetical protein
MPTDNTPDPLPDYRVPIRPGVLALVRNLPPNLTTAEADRLAAWLRTLAVDAPAPAQPPAPSLLDATRAGLEAAENLMAVTEGEGFPGLADAISLIKAALAAKGGA